MQIHARAGEAVTCERESLSRGVRFGLRERARFLSRRYLSCVFLAQLPRGNDLTVVFLCSEDT